MTQKEYVLRHLEAGRTLTALEALTEYGTMRLAAYIQLLRKEGYNIRTKMERTFTGRPYAVYSLVESTE